MTTLTTLITMVTMPIGRVPISAASADPGHPVLVATVAQLGEYFAGERQEFDLPLDPVGTDFQQSAWSASEDHSVRHHGQLRRTGRADGRPTQGPCRRCGERSEPDLDRGAVSSGGRLEWSAHRIRRRHRQQGLAPRPRATRHPRCLTPMMSRSGSDPDRDRPRMTVRRGCGRPPTGPCGRVRLPSSLPSPRRAWP